MSTFTQSMDPESIAVTKEHFRIMKEYAIVWFTILVWDTLATLPAEWVYIHRAKWTPLKVMFLINRWFTIAAQASTAFLLLAPLSPNICRKIFWGFATDGIAVMFFCDCIIAIRVYAVYEKSRKMLYFLVGMLAMELAVMIGAATQLRPVIYTKEIREALQFEGCAAAIPNGKYGWLISVIYYCPPLVVNAIALVLIFHRNFKLTQQAGRIPILQRMLKDGLFFFVVILAANLVNVVLVASQTSPALKNFNIPASLTLTSLMCSRLVLSLHQHNADIRRSQAGGTLEHIASGDPSMGPSMLQQTTRASRLSQISCRSASRRPLRPPIDICEEDDDDLPGSSSATDHEADSSETVNDDKFRTTTPSSSTTTNPSPIPIISSLARDLSFLSPPPSSTPSTPQIDQAPGSRRLMVNSRTRRSSVVSFATPEDAV